MAAVSNKTRLSESEFALRFGGFENIGGLAAALDWAANEHKANSVPRVIMQDEFTHDVVFEYDGLFVVFDTT